MRRLSRCAVVHNRGGRAALLAITCVLALWTDTQAAAPATKPASQPSSQPTDLRKIISLLQQQVSDLKAENQRLKIQVNALEKQLPKNPKGVIPGGMYDAMKDLQHPGDGGMPMHGSQLRPEDPSRAYEDVKNEMTFDQVISILGGFQNDRESDEIRTVEWIFDTASGGDLTISVRFKDGKVTGKTRNARG